MRGKHASKAANVRAASAQDSLATALASLASEKAGRAADQQAHRVEVARITGVLAAEIADSAQERFTADVERQVVERSAALFSKQKHSLRVEIAKIVGAWLDSEDVMFRFEAIAALAADLNLGKDASALTASIPGNRSARRTGVRKLNETAQARRMGKL